MRYDTSVSVLNCALMCVLADDGADDANVLTKRIKIQLEPGYDSIM